VKSRFEDRVAIVTGSSSGIGKAVARQLAEEGAAVCVVANRNVEGGEATAEFVRQVGGRSIFVQADVAVTDDCRRVVDETLAAFGQVDVLINNAGITRFRSLLEMEEDLWDQVMDTNLKSAYLMSRYVLPSMLERGRGAVVNISSVHAVATYAGSAVYAASKAGMCGMTRSLACEYGARGVRFNCILPGTIDISLYGRKGEPVDPEAWQPHPSEAQVLKRTGSPVEVAAAICFLAADEASFVNGASLTVDGGLLCLLRDR